MHDDDSVVLRRKNKKIAADSSGLGDRRRLSWSISDLSRLPAVRTSSSLVKTRCSRVRNTSISSCSLSSGSSSFSIRSNGSVRRKARIPVTGFAEKAFLANERRMIEDADIIVKEDFEPVVKAEAEAEILNNNKTKPKSFHENVDQNKNYNNVVTTLEKRKARHSDMAESPHTDRESISSISSFSSSFEIDRIFHWRKSTSRPCKEDKSVPVALVERRETPTNDNDKQIDSIAAQSLAVYNSVSSESSLTIGEKLPEKPLRFHIKQLEMILMGSLSPPSSMDQEEVQLKLDSLRVMESLQSMNWSKECQSQIVYDFPRYLHC